jgi:hypothetical protein
MDSVQQSEEDYRRKMKLNFDKRHNSRSLTCLNPGDDVWLRDRNEIGTIRETLHDRAYEVVTPKGAYVRNRVQLSHLPSENQATPSATPSAVTDVPSSPTPVVSRPDKEPAVPITKTRYGREVKVPSRYQE